MRSIKLLEQQTRTRTFFDREWDMHLLHARRRNQIRLPAFHLHRQNPAPILIPFFDKLDPIRLRQCRVKVRRTSFPGGGLQLEMRARVRVLAVHEFVECGGQAHGVAVWVVPDNRLHFNEYFVSKLVFVAYCSHRNASKKNGAAGEEERCGDGINLHTATVIGPQVEDRKCNVRSEFSPGRESRNCK